MMRYCRCCILPDTRPGLTLGADSVCSACRDHDARSTQVDWARRRLELEEVFRRARKRPRGYDCIVPVSGGKDSTWQVVQCREFGLRILAVTWKTPGRTSLGQANLENLMKLGVDHIDYTIDENVERTFMRKALERTGSTGVPMHMAIYAIPLRLAVQLRIPLVVWGENPHEEYGRTDDRADSDHLGPQWGRRHGILQNTAPEDWVDNDLTFKDLEPYFQPSDEEFAESGVQSIFLGHYLKWDPEESLRVARQYGFQSRPEGPRIGLYDYADIDCEFISVHHHFKWLKFGFTRLFDNLALEIRNGRMARSDAIAVVREYGDQTPHEDIDAVCRFLHLSREAFGRIEEKFRNHAVWEQRDGVWRIPGFLIPDWEWS